LDEKNNDGYPDCAHNPNHIQPCFEGVTQQDWINLKDSLKDLWKWLNGGDPCAAAKKALEQGDDLEDIGAILVVTGDPEAGGVAAGVGAAEKLDAKHMLKRHGCK
jgi:hypothetical protein